MTAIVVLVAIWSEPTIPDTPSPSPTPTSTQTQEPEQSAEPEPEPTATEEPRNILILRSNIVGVNLSEVTANLTEQGFVVNAIPGELIPGDDPRVRTVYAVSPTGSITQGTTIDVTYYVGDFTEIPVEIPSDEPTEPVVDPNAPADPNATPDPNATTDPAVTDSPTPTPTESTSSG